MSDFTTSTTADLQSVIELPAAPAIETLPARTASVDPSTLLARAVDQGLDVDQLGKLMELHERWESNQARKAFNAAMAAFQSMVPRITKAKTVDFPSKRGGRVNYSYAPLADIREQIKETLEKCGLSVRFAINQAAGRVNVTCIVTHVDGHSEETSMEGAEDAKMTGNQAIGSTVTFLSRYAMIGALGLTTADDDIDGRLPDAYKNPVSTTGAPKVPTRSMRQRCNQLYADWQQSDWATPNNLIEGFKSFVRSVLQGECPEPNDWTEDDIDAVADAIRKPKGDS